MASLLQVQDKCPEHLAGMAEQEWQVKGAAGLDYGGCGQLTSSGMGPIHTARNRGACKFGPLSLYRGTLKLLDLCQSDR